MKYSIIKTLVAVCAFVLASGCASHPLTYGLDGSEPAERPTAAEVSFAGVEVLSNPPGAMITVNNAQIELTPSRIRIELTPMGTIAQNVTISVDYSGIVGRNTEVVSVTLKAGQVPPRKVTLLRGGEARIE